MPAATTKAELIAAAKKDWAKLEALIADVPEEIAVRPFEDDTSIKDVLAHRAIGSICSFNGWTKARPLRCPTMA
jgi:hypothetical protein